jgi:hypothetical protein
MVLVGRGEKLKDCLKHMTRIKNSMSLKIKPSGQLRRSQNKEHLLLQLDRPAQ